MPRYTPDGRTKVTWVVSLEDPCSPSVTELDAGIDLECHLTKDGLNITFNENAVDSGALCEVFDAQLAGTFGLSAELTMKRRNTEGGDTDAAWAIFSHGDNGYLVVRRGVLLEDFPDWEVGDAAETYIVQSGNKRPAASATNEEERFMVTFYGTEAPCLDATVTAT